jgi:predicted MPP superfamily phosphohydrolase
LPAIALVVVVAMAARRSRRFGVFAGVLLGIPTWVAVALGPQLPGGAALGVAQLLAAGHLVAITVRPAMRPAWFRWGVSVPGLWFIAGSLLALPWAIVASFGLYPWGGWIPFALAAFGVFQSSWTREEVVSMRLDVPAGPELAPHRASLQVGEGRPLRIVQITYPHLGPFMSVERLRRICQRAVEREPDLILLTGDLMTMESHDVVVVTEALAPLAAAKGRVFACHGNHDHEARRVVEQAYAAHDITLLVDEDTVVQTEAGAVQIVGLDFVWRGREAHIMTTLDEHPREGDALRVVLLHDPGGFKFIPDGDADLVLSGHTHGGQLGLLSLGLQTTVLRGVTTLPDHGPWAKGRNRLYVHRAQGHYGYPVRLGVPAEQSLLQVYAG